MLVGAVLAGGASRRMGRPKALVEIDGVPMAALAAAALRDAGVAEGAVVLVGGDPAWARELGLRWVPDRWPGDGPLGGIATAVLDAPAAADVPDAALVLVVACDQPWLTGAALTSLVGAVQADPGVGAATALGPDGRRQPFPSVWRTAAGPVVAGLVAAGERRADAAFGATVVADVGLAAELLADVDRPGDLPPVP